MKSVRTDDKQPQPQIIDAVWEPVAGAPREPERPRGFVERLADDSERLEREAMGMLDSIDRTAKAGSRIAGSVKRLFGRIKQDFGVSARLPIRR